MDIDGIYGVAVANGPAKLAIPSSTALAAKAYKVRFVMEAV